MQFRQMDHFRAAYRPVSMELHTPDSFLDRLPGRGGLAQSSWYLTSMAFLAWPGSFRYIFRVGNSPRKLYI